MIERRRVDNLYFRRENSRNLIVQRWRRVIAIIVVIVIWSRNIAAIAVISWECSKARLMETCIVLIINVDELLGIDFFVLAICRFVQDEEIRDDCVHVSEESEKLSHTIPWNVHLKKIGKMKNALNCIISIMNLRFFFQIAWFSSLEPFVSILDSAWALPLLAVLKDSVPSFPWWQTAAQLIAA